MNKGLDELLKIADEDMKIDKSALDNESLKGPRLHNQWLRRLYDRKDKLFAYELKKKEVYKSLWLYYNGKAVDSEYERKGSFDIRIMKADIGMFIESDPEMKEIEAKIFIVKQEMEFIVKTLEELNRRTFVISNALKALAFLNGMN
jgi:hypothetical protein